MEQRHDRSDSGRSHPRIGPQRKSRVLKCLALACSLAALSLTLAQDPTQVKSPEKFNEKIAWEHLNKQVGFGPRMPGMEGHIKCRDWMMSELEKSCENVRKQEFTHKWSYTNKTLTMWNVIAEQNWKDAKTRILLIAHWDTRPFADQDRDQANFNKPIAGANDGASGVAVLLELARVMKNKLPKDVGVMYLLTDGEDVGPELSEMFLGATYFANNQPNPKPDYGILIDMIGDKDLEIPIEPNSLYYAPKLIRAFFDHAAEVGLGSTFPKRQGPYIEDDHMILNKMGIPTIDLIDFSYEPWHTMRDTPEQCSAASLGKVGMALETWLLKQPPFKI